MKSTNYVNTFISTAPTCKKTVGTIPPKKNPATIAQLEYDLISQQPYQLTSDEILFEIYKQRHKDSTMKDFLAINKACFRCSSLTQNYGWGIHFDEMGRAALYGIESSEYQQLLDDGEIKQKPAFAAQK